MRKKDGPLKILIVLAAILCIGRTETPAQESSIRVMSYNIYRGGTMRKQPLSQTAKVIQAAKADIVGIQEPRSPKGFNTQKLADLLGWNHSANIRKGIVLTPYKIVENLNGGIKVKLPSGQHAYLFSLHLPSNPYQPYQLLSIRPKWHKHWDTPFLKTEAEAIEAAQKARGGEISKLLKQVRDLPDKEAPVFVVGDFNEPSHLDWTREAALAGRHPLKVDYPNSRAMSQAGFVDAYRTVYPDEMKNPGFTWSPMYKKDDPTTHHDRIDFVYFKGKGVQLNAARIVGENREHADIVVSPYPSDHRAVVATFTLPDASIPEKPTDKPGVNLPAQFGLHVTTYASSSDQTKFRGTLHIAFGPGNQEIVTDSYNNRFLYRDGPRNRFESSPLPVKGQHSVAYNPADGLYYANDTGNHRIVSFSDLSNRKITAQTKNIAGIPLNRPHDIVVDPSTGWIYAINPNSGHVFRFTAIGKNESVISVPVQGYARALTFANGRLFAIGSAKGRIVEIVDWDTPTFKIYDSLDPTKKLGPAGSWTKTGLVLNDAEFFNGFWYATSYFTRSYASGSDFDRNKFIRFKTLEDLVKGNWTDLSSLLPTGMTPYYLTVNRGNLFLAIFNHESRGSGDSILKITQSTPPSSQPKNEKRNR